MATQAERLAVVETKVDNIEGKVGEIKHDVKEMHDCLDRTRDLLDAKLESMLDEYRSNRTSFYTHADDLHKENKAEHAALAGKIAELEKSKHKFTLQFMIALSFMAGAGWIGHVDITKLLKFVGL